MPSNFEADEQYKGGINTKLLNKVSNKLHEFLAYDGCEASQDTTRAD